MKERCWYAFVVIDGEENTLRMAYSVNANAAKVQVERQLEKGETVEPLGICAAFDPNEAVEEGSRLMQRSLRLRRLSDVK